LGSRLQEVWLWNTRLKVNRARFGREKQQLVEEGVAERRKTVVAAGEGPSIVTGKSFKQALGREKGQFVGKTEERQCLLVQPSEEMLELLKWSYVGELHQNLEAKEVQQMLVLEGLSAVKVTTIGEKMLLLQVDGNKELQGVISNHKLWWDASFLKVSIWSPPMVVSRRSVWLQIHGIPIHVWDEPIFKAIGNLFGGFIDFDEDTASRNRLDFARIKVSTTRKGLIDEHVEISVVGAVFCLWVVEEGGGRRWEPVDKERMMDDVTSVGSREGDVDGGEWNFVQRKKGLVLGLCVLHT
jgi:hypothetical protein